MLLKLNQVVVVSIDTTRGEVPPRGTDRPDTSFDPPKGLRT